MASPQKENGYLSIANEVVEVLAKADWFGGSNARVMWCIFRKTYGWHKKQDDISISQIVAMTELSKRTVIYALQELEAKKIIFVVRKTENGLKSSNEIRFNKDYDTWVVQNSAPQVEKNRNRAKVSSAKLRSSNKGSAKLSNLVVQNSVKKVNSFAHTKETKQKINTKDTSDVPSQEIVSIIESFKEINHAHGKWYGNTTQRGACERLLKMFPLEQILKVIAIIPKTNKIPYMPSINTPLQLEDKWSQLEAQLIKKKTEINDKKPNFII